MITATAILIGTANAGKKVLKKKAPTLSKVLGSFAVSTVQSAFSAKTGLPLLETKLFFDSKVGFNDSLNYLIGRIKLKFKK